MNTISNFMKNKKTQKLEHCSTGCSRGWFAGSVVPFHKQKSRRKQVLNATVTIVGSIRNS